MDEEELSSALAQQYGPQLLLRVDAAPIREACPAQSRGIQHAHEVVVSRPSRIHSIKPLLIFLPWSEDGPGVHGNPFRLTDEVILEGVETVGCLVVIIILLFFFFFLLLCFFFFFCDFE